MKRKYTTLKNHYGFTLIEILIVLAIIGLLALAAMPNFGQQHIKLQRRAAISDLSNLLLLQERYRHAYSRYTLALDELGAGHIIDDNNGSYTTKDKHYTLTANTCAPQTDITACIEISAQRQPPQSDSHCQRLSANTVGQFTGYDHHGRQQDDCIR